MSAADDLARAAYNAGFRGNDLVTIVAIGLAEGGFPGSTNDARATTGEYSVGPWQINLAAWGQKITETAARAYDSAAKFVYYIAYESGQGFGAWSVYTGGQYRSQIAAAQNAVVSLGRPDALTGGIGASTGGGGGSNISFGPEFDLPNSILGRVFDLIPGNPLGGVAAALAGIAQPFQFIGQFFEVLLNGRTWWRIGFTLLGVSLIAGGILIYVFAPRSREEAQGMAARAATAGV
ncbi:hypothetical protein [Hyphomicrobium sp.]|uniref:hypothetical protein n=1 Tax=Hyphomicrobium sp. TaxID=82 RepID=UPI0025BA6F6E|nr:hypothetical protein [Hyphomicrobium sp.]MCC7254256.1 hypothetical protein [Hyphomicrobium sp.]